MGSYGSMEGRKNNISARLGWGKKKYVIDKTQKIRINDWIHLQTLNLSLPFYNSAVKVKSTIAQVRCQV